MSRTFKKDYKFGTDNEKNILPILRKTLKDDQIQQCEYKYCKYDYFSKYKRIELKSRNNRSDKYVTTMISLSKIKDAKDYEGDYYYFFQFTDQLMMIKYNKEIFDKYECKIGGRCDRGKVESNDYVFIPIKDLETVIIE